MADNSILKERSKIWKGWWKKNDCWKNPNSLFVFGDNDIGKGCGGQAIIRYECNSIGIPTKKIPSNAQSSFYTDDEYQDNCNKIDKAINKIAERVEENQYTTILFPEDGLGTGLARLNTNAPKTLEYLNQRLSDVFGIEY